MQEELDEILKEKGRVRDLKEKVEIVVIGEDLKSSRVIPSFTSLGSLED